MKKKGGGAKGGGVGSARTKSDTINDRLIMRHPLRKSVYATVIRAFVSTMTNSDETQKEFPNN